MRKVGETWVEEIDGQRHLLKYAPDFWDENFIKYLEKNNYDWGKAVENYEATEGVQFDGVRCSIDCINAVFDQDCVECVRKVGERCYGCIKDMGVVDENGCLPCPFTGEYPRLETKENAWLCIAIKEEGSIDKIYFTTSIVGGFTKEEAIANWNRRA